MWLYIEVVGGEQSGERFTLREGARLGRASAEILLKDSKISTLHAQIERDRTGQLVLVDRDSRNGMTLNGEKIKRIAMMPGVTFKVGRTELRVIEGAAPEGDSFNPTMSQPDGQGLQNWQVTLQEEVPKMLMANQQPSENIQPFTPPLLLQFLEGPQADLSVVLGYGPRKFGASVLDVELQDPVAPFLAFEIQSFAGEPRFITREAGIMLNGRIHSMSPLRDGDTIRLGKTLIRVNFLKTY